jgi:hypothetical protein
VQLGFYGIGVFGGIGGLKGIRVFWESRGSTSHKKRRASLKRCLLHQS